MKAILVYKSKTGFTKRYAEWIGEQSKIDLCSITQLDKNGLNGYDVVVFGSRIHAGKIDGLKKFRKRVPANTRLIVYATGATPAEEQDAIEKIWSDNLIGDLPHFYMQSGLNYEKMKGLDKFLMKLLAKIVGKDKNASESEKGFGQAIQSSYDISSRDCVKPLTDYLN